MTLYRHVDGMSNDWEEHAELDRHTVTKGSYETRVSVATDSMPDGVIVVRDMGGDIDSFMVPVEPCVHGNYDTHITGHDGFDCDGTFAPVTRCHGAGLEEES